MSTTSHALVAAVVTAALAAPAAQAMQADGPVKPHVLHAVRCVPDWKRAMMERGATLNKAVVEKRGLPGWAAWHAAPKPVSQTQAAVKAAPTEPADDGFPWDTIAFGLAGAALAFTAAATAVGLRRRSHHARAAA
jgi:hypothetical protein